MKKYLVNVWSEETYKKVFKANSKEEAEEKAREEIDEVGADYENGWKTGYNADYGITDVEEVKKTGRPKVWTDENIKLARELMILYSATKVGKRFGKSKNAVLGVLYRDKVKNGYGPPPDSKYTGKKENYPKHLTFK